MSIAQMVQWQSISWHIENNRFKWVFTLKGKLLRQTASPKSGLRITKWKKLIHRLHNLKASFKNLGTCFWVFSDVWWLEIFFGTYNFNCCNILKKIFVFSEFCLYYHLNPTDKSTVIAFINCFSISKQNKKSPIFPEEKEVRI